MTTPATTAPVVASDPLAQYTEERWRKAVRKGETTQGYAEWRMHQRRDDVVEFSLMELSDRDTGTLLAALRYYQIQTGIPVRFVDIASDEGKQTPLNSREIDDLCQRINTIETKFRVEGYMLRHADGKCATICRHKPSERTRLKVSKLIEVPL